MSDANPVSGPAAGDLVEPEGVNAGSAAQPTEPARPASGSGDVRSGGAPERAPEEAPGAPDARVEGGELLGPPPEEPDTAPGQQLAAGEG